MFNHLLLALAAYIDVSPFNGLFPGNGPVTGDDDEEN